MQQNEYVCEYTTTCVEGATCTAHLAEGRAFACSVKSYQDVFDMEYRCDCQYTEGYKQWLQSKKDIDGFKNK